MSPSVIQVIFIYSQSSLRNGWLKGNTIFSGSGQSGALVVTMVVGVVVNGAGSDVCGVCSNNGSDGRGGYGGGIGSRYGGGGSGGHSSGGDDGGATTTAAAHLW